MFFLLTINHLATFATAGPAQNPSNVVPGEIFDAVVISCLVIWAIAIWYVNFGPGAKKTTAEK